MGEIGIVMDLDLPGVPFTVLIVGLSLVVEVTQVWLVVFWLNISAPCQMIGLANK